MESVLSPEGSLALATSALVVVLGWRFALPERALAVTVALVRYVWLATVEEREAREAFGAEWVQYAARTRAVLPIPRRARG